MRHELLYELDFIDPYTHQLKREYQVRSCPFCEVDDGEFIENQQTQDAVFFKFKKCNRCFLIYPYPRINLELLYNFFSPENLPAKIPSSQVEKRSLVRKCIGKLLDGLSLRYNYQDFLKYIKKGDRVLELGAGTGSVTKVLLTKKCNIDIVEINPKRAKYLKENFDVNVFNQPFEDFKTEQQYDVVVLSRVLMHLFSIKDTIRKVYSLLKDKGIVMTSVTNFDSVIQRTIRSPYPGRGLTPFSLSAYFTVESATRIMQLSGFQVMKIYHKPEGLLEYLFGSDYPKGYRTLLKILDLLIMIVLRRAGASSYFTIVAKK